MADKKITQLNNITGANLVDADEFVVVDISADETKAITLGELKEAFDAGSGFVRVTGDTMTGALDVQSTITADGLTVDNISADGNTISSTTGGLFLDAVGTFTLDTGSAERLRVASNGDISFYEDTGTTPKFFWDASAESLGIGTVTPDTLLQLAASNGGITTAGTGNNTLRFEDLDPTKANGQVTGTIDWYTNDDTATGVQAWITADSTNVGAGSLAFGTGVAGATAERMRITSSGNVGIGTGSPSSPLHIDTNADGNILQMNGGSEAWDLIARSSNGTSPLSGEVIYSLGMYRNDGASSPNGVINFGRGGSTQNGYLTFDVNGSEAMRIDSSGYVGINYSNPSIFGTVAVVQKASGKGIAIVDATVANTLFLENNTSQCDIKNNTTKPIVFSTNSAEAMRIDSSGSVGIGVVPSSVLHVKAATPVFTLQATAVGNAATPFISGVDSNSDVKWRVGNLSTGTPDLFISSNGGGTRFTTGSGYTEAMRIDYSGKVGIGTASPAHELSVVSAGDTTVEIKSTGTGDADALLILDSAATGESEVQFFHDGVHGASIQWFTDGSPDLNIATVAGTDGVIDFQPNNSLAMRIDSSGNLLVGKSAADTGATSGFEYNAAVDVLYATRAGTTAVFNRLTTDGDIALFRKDNVTVGSIGVVASDRLYIATDDSGNSGLAFDGDNSRIYACTSTGATSSATTDLGSGTQRFKDLYLSGGAYLGGTGSSNKLDDYEEGTWTATSGSAGSLTVSGGAYYTKVGRTVTLHLNGASFSDITSTLGLKINGIPFTAGSAYAVGHTLIRNRDDDVALICFISGAGSQIRFYKSSTTSSFIELNHTIFNSTSNSMYLSITYQTA